MCVCVCVCVSDSTFIKAGDSGTKEGLMVEEEKERPRQCFALDL